MVNIKALEAIEWYSNNRNIYGALANKVESIIREILESNDINFYSIGSRAKPLSSYERKAIEGGYENPRSDIMDMAGVRVITYTDLDAKSVANLIVESFEIYPEHSPNKIEELGVDRVGYRSIHYIGTLGTDRSSLPENRIFRDMFFETQIRTILQHAWAEFEHDRNYKFSGVLPTEIRRRLSILSGTLELLDREFDNLSQDIDEYILDVSQKTERGELSISINSKSLSEYMTRRFKILIENGVESRIINEVIEELTDMEINTLEELEGIIPRNFIEVKLKHPSEIMGPDNFTGVLRDIMMIYDIETYFETAWKQHWFSMEFTTIDVLEEYGVNLSNYIKKHGLDVIT